MSHGGQKGQGHSNVKGRGIVRGNKGRGQDTCLAGTSGMSRGTERCRTSEGKVKSPSGCVGRGDRVGSIGMKIPNILI